MMKCICLFFSDYAMGCYEDVTINTPSPMEALSGSCLNIPCTYTGITIDPEISFKGIWFKSDVKNVISVSGDSSKSYPMNITGNLKNRDCTTMFHDLTQPTAACTNLQIRVRDAPGSPSIKVSGEQTETEIVTITCSAVTPCPRSPPQLTWDLHQGTSGITENNITEKNPDGTITTKTKLNITLTDSHDGLMIKCSAVYPVSGGVKATEENVTLNVTYGPKNTSVQVRPSGTLSTGQSVTLSCSSRAKPPVQNFTWFRNSSQGPVSVSEGNTYNFSICDGGDYYCVASNPLSNDSSQDVHLRITGTQAEVVQREENTHYEEIDLSKLKPKEASKHEEKDETVKVSQAKPTEDTVHYGEIDFSKFSPKVVLEKELEETVYSQVQGAKSANNGGQFSDGVDDLYANVKKN
uniref:Ig-like domain-containing protein n=1 Tax=Neogobius melanostomus TaxID=47308 RepID=A0A8C6WN76_9GOBI